MRLTAALSFVLSAALLLTGCELGDFDAFQAHFEHQYDLQPGARLILENANGSVEIEGWDRNAIEIAGVRFASSRQLLDEVRIDIRHTPDSIEIRTEKPSGRFGGAGARYTIHVPRKTAVDRIVTSNGSILLRDIEAGPGIQTVSLRTSNAAIRAANIQGAVEARTSNGSVDLNDIGGAATATTSNGRIGIELDRPAASPLKAITSNGRIEIALRSQPRDIIRAETSNGSITLHLPAYTNAHLRADTSNAEISTEFDAHDRAEPDGRANRLDQILGTGGPGIELSTRNGHIGILKTL